MTIENQREYQKRHYNKNKEYYSNKRSVRRDRLVALLAEYKATLTCCLCPENDPIALDFHHGDPKRKEALIGSLVRQGTSWDKVVAELEKCYCLCANCHRKVHKHVEWMEKLATIPMLHVELRASSLAVKALDS